MKRLITDHDILTGAVAPPLLLDENTLITPSARDRAARLGWALVESGARAAPAAASAAMAPVSLASTRAAPAPACGAATPCGRCGTADCPGTCGAAPGETLADGVYLVRIEGGRRVSVLPAAGPGVMTRALAALPASLRGGA